jgi:hypothetical protein
LVAVWQDWLVEVVFPRAGGAQQPKRLGSYGPFPRFVFPALTDLFLSWLHSALLRAVAVTRHGPCLEKDRKGAADATLEKATEPTHNIVSEAMKLPGTGKKKISEKPENNNLFTASNS